MFHRILVVLSATDPNTDSFTVALSYAKACNATLRVVDASGVLASRTKWLEKLRSLQDLSFSMGLAIEVVRSARTAVWQIANQWSADLIVLSDSESLNAMLTLAPCSVLQVQCKEQMTSVQMILKQDNQNGQRQRLEALFRR